MKPNAINYHAMVSRDAPLAIDLDIARELGFDGIEVSARKAQAYLDAGHSDDELRALFAGVDVPAIGFVLDIERQGREREALLREADGIFRLARLVGARGVQLLTGPVDARAVADFRRGRPVAGYTGLLGRPEGEQLDLTARNVASLAARAADHGLVVFLEALSWTPLNTIGKQLAIIERSRADNVRMVVDFWHCYTSGNTPEDVARIDKDLIYGVHVCDSLAFAGGVPDENVLRDVPTGQGVLDLKAWANAVKATGYAGWWSCELFCRRQWQENSYDVAAGLKALMHDLVG